MPKFMAMSDIHGYLPNADVVEKLVDDKYDALLLVGDIFEMNVKNKPLAKWLKTVSHDHRVIMTPGNHDHNIFEWYMLDHEGTYVCVSRRYPFIQKYSPDFLMGNYGIEVLIDQETSVDNVRIWGSPWSDEFCNWAFMGNRAHLEKKYNLIPDGIDIILSHGPPMSLDPEYDIDVNTEEDERCRLSDKHLGSSSLTKAIRRIKPTYLLCGHIHSGDHNECLIGKTRCYNVSYVNESYMPAYPVLEFEVEKD